MNDTAKKQSYVTFYPNTNVKYIKIVNSADQSMADVLKDRTIMKTDTVLMTKFVERQVDASYFSMLTDEYESVFTIYKKTPNQDYYQYLCTLTGENYKFTDYNVNGNQFYHYLASAELANTADNGGIGYMIYENLDSNSAKNYMHIVFDGWSICDIEESADEEGVYYKSGRVWELGLNVNGEDVTYNTNVASWDTLGKYPKFSIGNRKYKSMTFTGLLGNMREYTKYNYEANTDTNSSAETTTSSSVYQYTEKLEKYSNKVTDSSSTLYDERWGIWDPYAREADKLDAWNDFISDGSLKLLKDIKGNAWIVQISDSSSSSINTVAVGQPTTITFSWKEAVDITDTSIIYFGDTTYTED